MNPPPDSIVLIIAASAGIFIGATLGFIACGILADRRRRKECNEAWKLAGVFYRANFNLTPKN